MIRWQTLSVVAMLAIGSPWATSQEPAINPYQLREGHQIDAGVQHVRDLDLTQPDDRLQLVTLIADPEQHLHVRQEAALRLDGSPDLGPVVQDTLLRMIKVDEDPQCRGMAIYRLKKVGTPASQAVPVLIKALDDGGTVYSTRCTAITVRSRALQVLGEYGPEARDAIPVIAEWAKPKGIYSGDRDSQIVLGQIDPWAYPFYAYGEASVLPLAKVLVDDADVQRRRDAANRLHALGTVATPAAESLRQAFDDSDEQVRITAAATLIAQGDQGRSVEVLSSALQSESADNRLRLAEWLGDFEPPLLNSDTMLIEMVSDADPRVRRAAALSLDDAKVLVRLLGDSDPLVRLAMARRLTHRGEHYEEVVTTLLAMIATEEPKHRTLALGILRQVPHEARLRADESVARLLMQERIVARHAAPYLRSLNNPSPAVRAIVEQAAREAEDPQKVHANKVLNAWKQQEEAAREAAATAAIAP